MSASDKKKLRKEQAVEALTAKQQQQKSADKSLRRTTVAFVVAMILVLGFGLATVCYKTVTNNGLIERMSTAAVIGDHKLSAIELGYYYNDAVMEFYNEWASEEYGDDILTEGLEFDPGEPLNEQTYSEEDGTTWADYFIDIALENATHDYVLCDLAEEAGWELSETEQEELDTMIENLETNALLYGYSNAKQFMRAYYGPGYTVKNYRAYMERQAIADGYYAYYAEELSYDDATLRAHEEGKFDDFSSYSYDSLYLSYTYFQDMVKETETTEPEATEPESSEPTTETAPEATEPEATEPEATEPATEPSTEATEPEATEPETEEETKEEAEKTTIEEARELLEAAAAELATAKTVEELEEKIEALKVKDGVSLHPTHTKNTLRTALSASNKALTDWVTAAERKPGDVGKLPVTTTKEVDGEKVEETNGYYIVIFGEKNDNNTKMGDVRHLLVKFEGGTTDEESGETVYSDEEKAAAKKQAQEYLDKWKAGGATEEYFIELVKEYSQDTYLDDGGLYENIYKGSGYVENFENWAVDESRKTGDAEIIETEYGYHVMYYVGDSKLTYRDKLIRDEIAAEDLETWYNEAIEAVEPVIKSTKHMAMDLVITPGVEE